MLYLTLSLACGAFFRVSVAATTSTNVCPLLGPAFAMPSALSSNSQFEAAMKDFDSVLTQSLETGISTYGSAPFNATTISIGIFSITEEELLYQRHFADQSVRTSSIGTTQPDADSIYRIGSISKLLTTYLFLIQEGDQRFGDPITKYIPELALAASNTSSQNGVTPDWTQVTLVQLASHMAGLAEDYGLDDLAGISSPALPPLTPDQTPNCNIVGPDIVFIPCSTQEYLDGVATEPAFFSTSYTPLYSNNGFELLGLALERMTNSTMQDLFTKSIANPLGLHHTSYTVPNSTQNAVIPGGNTTTTGWDAVMGTLSPAGAYFSTTTDMALIGRSILNSTLLSPSQTRGWMKPVTFTSSMDVAVGAPWEIARVTCPSGSPSAGRIVDLYTKTGGWGAYGTILVLIPDYGVGFSILTATGLPTGESPLTVYLLADMLSGIILPCLKDIARSQANATYGGHYAAFGLNSSLTISVDNQPGLRVMQWISNGTAGWLEDLLGADASQGQYVDFRLQPNQVYPANAASPSYAVSPNELRPKIAVSQKDAESSKDAGSLTEVGFTGTWQVLPSPIYTGSSM